MGIQTQQGTCSALGLGTEEHLAEGGVEDLAGTYGALLLGGLVSARCVPVTAEARTITLFRFGSLSGVVIIQTLIYYKLFPCDAPWRKLLVLVILFVPDPSSHRCRLTPHDYQADGYHA